MGHFGQHFTLRTSLYLVPMCAPSVLHKPGTNNNWVSECLMQCINNLQTDSPVKFIVNNNKPSLTAFDNKDDCSMYSTLFICSLLLVVSDYTHLMGWLNIVQNAFVSFVRSHCTLRIKLLLFSSHLVNERMKGALIYYINSLNLDF